MAASGPAHVGLGGSAHRAGRAGRPLSAGAMGRLRVLGRRGVGLSGGPLGRGLLAVVRHAGASAVRAAACRGHQQRGDQQGVVDVLTSHRFLLLHGNALQEAGPRQCPPNTWNPRLRRLSASHTSISTALAYRHRVQVGMTWASAARRTSGRRTRPSPRSCGSRSAARASGRSSPRNTPVCCRLWGSAGTPRRRDDDRLRPPSFGP